MAKTKPAARAAAKTTAKVKVPVKVVFTAHKAVSKVGAVPYIPHLSHPRPPVNHAPGKNYLGAVSQALK